MKIAGIEIEGPLDAALATAGQKLTVVGATGYSVGWILSNQAGIFFGILGVIAGIGINIYFSYHRHKRERAEHALRMDELRQEIAREVLAAARVAAEAKLADAQVASEKVLADAEIARVKRDGR